MTDSQRIGFLMDPFERLNLETDTSLLCIDELLMRGVEVYWLEQDDLDLTSQGLQARLQRVKATTPLQLDSPVFKSIDFLQGLLIRKDPPFDASYLHLTYLLDFLPASVVAMNAPSALRNINEKLATLHWPADCPDTLVTRAPERLLAFVRTHGRVVLKPLDECSGRGIEFLDANEPDLAARIQLLLAETNGYRLAQQYLPAVKLGDKRIYLVSDEPVGWVNRIPAAGSDLANIHQGAMCETTQLTSEERLMCGRVGGWLSRQGVLLSGLDFIGGKLTEINVTSPSAVRQINAVAGIRLETRLVDAILGHMARR